MTRHGEAAEGWQGIQGQYLIPTSATGCRNATNGWGSSSPKFQGWKSESFADRFVERKAPLAITAMEPPLLDIFNAFKMVGFPLRCCIQDGKKAWSSLGIWQQKGLSKLFLSTLQIEIHAFHRDSCSLLPEKKCVVMSLDKSCPTYPSRANKQRCLPTQSCGMGGPFSTMSDVGPTCRTSVFETTTCREWLSMWYQKHHETESNHPFHSMVFFQIEPNEPFPWDILGGIHDDF